MTYLHNDPHDFFREMVDGFVTAYPDRVAGVPGGVVRATAVPRGQVAVVIGGGSGHYPAFAGLVGPGLAHAAAMGNVFASPSAQQVYSVAKAADAGGGVLLTYGNYAGDCLNFDEAQERLRAGGIGCQTVTVTDDISSAPAAERSKRRGIAGDLCVFKAAAWAAERGWSLDEVTRFTALANDRTRSFGVAFSGCTLPGADAPLFEVPKGRMGVGMGIHGEQGLHEADLGSADEVAGILVSGLLADLPEGMGSPAGQRAAVLTNGLGSVSYEELFVLHGAIARLLREAGVTIVEPDVGELCTSFDMAGVSLTLCWLTDELEQAWHAPADAPAYRKGSVAPQVLGDQRETVQAGETHVAVAGDDSRRCGRVVAAAIEAASARVDASVDELGALDAVAGDGDHGIGMQRGAAAAATASARTVAEGAGAGTVLTSAGDAWADAAGGTSGALWGVLLRAMGTSFGDDQAPGGRGVAEAVNSALDAVMRTGKAQVGDKTMVDALAPFADELSREVGDEQDLPSAWSQAASVAATAAADTASLVAKVGRARPHAEKSIGTPDPGAVSMARILDAVGTLLQTEWIGRADMEPSRDEVRRR